MSGCNNCCGGSEASSNNCGCSPPPPITMTGCCQQQERPACDVCSTGCKQSPIDICSGRAVTFDMSPLIFMNHWLTDICLNMQLARETVVIKPMSESNMSLQGGPLRGNYILDQLHFRWGERDNNGSEHSIDGEKFAMEAHLMYFNCKYSCISAAYGKPDGIAIIAVMMQSKPTYHNCHMDPIISNFYKLRCPGASVTLNRNVIKMLKDILDSQDYFTYEGSLTEPPCSENVVWIVYRNVLCIHCSQVEPFRNLTNDEGRTICRNWRRTQPLNGRTVYSSRVCPCPSC